MNKNLTELICVIDESGSMSNITKDTINGYNALLNEQEKMNGELRVTTVLFNTEWTTLYSYKKCSDAVLNSRNYRPGGCTALCDAVCTTIDNVGKRLADTKECDRPSQVIFVIITDGYENSSRKFTKKDVINRITHQKEKYNWNFMYMGADIDVYGESKSIGIDEDNTFEFEKTKKGTERMYCQLNSYISEKRKK